MQTRDALRAVQVLAELLDELPSTLHTEASAEALDVLARASTGLSLEAVLELQVEAD